MRTWGEPCDAQEGRVDVHVTLTRAVASAALPDAAAANEVADDLQARADELGLALGDTGHRTDFRDPGAHVLELYSSDRHDNPRATVVLPVFDRLGAADEPLLRIDAEVPCARADGAAPLVGQEAEATRKEAQTQAQRALDALAPVLAATPASVEPTCPRPGERSGSVVHALRLRPGTSLRDLRPVLDRVWPTADGWLHHGQLAVDPTRPLLQYVRDPLTVQLEPSRPEQDPSLVRLEVGKVCFS